jgi:hypothetical protein
MRWSTIRLIWLREMRDQLRDRRTILMIVGLPLVLYPILGLCVFTFTSRFLDKPSRIGIVRPKSEPLEFPQRAAPIQPVSIAAIVGYASRPGLAAAVAVPISSAHLDDSPLVRGDSFKSFWMKRDVLASIDQRLKPVWYDTEEKAAEALEAGQIDAIMSTSPDFYVDLHRGEMGIEVRSAGEPESPPNGRATIRIRLKSESDRSDQALNRLRGVLDRCDHSRI